ncbi:Zinc finger, C2H2-like protein [Metarhizium album ARSEF 1941]|uniref:Zinc finger, C2H2-like protein n=1 Tax=Metarhizium album (strain ARSEF 1941) TaxID=1081103 RepID=A0A0B2WX57_METAS|nr:Zinc finger, C2H2-like protein [Metarhizium album ARSEF 1941]KHN98638.1 Zinc finger, C2H2-like protein [Metarhizium album ARSEF 1941]
MFPYQGQPHQTTSDDANVRPLTDEDQQQLWRLVQRYGIPSLLCALTGSPSSSGASTFSASTLISSISAPSLAWTGSDVSHCRSDDASIHTQYTWPDVSHDMQPMHDPEPSKISERSWLDSPAADPVPLPQNDITSHPSPPLLTPTSKKYQCPMCFLDSSPVGFGRKSDFKKHLHNFHGADVVWICQSKGCHLSFSTERAYSTHAKEAHRVKALPNSTARKELCTQLVFSCGFAACKDRLFESQSAEDASATRDKHFEHIAKHFEDGCDVKDWEYKVQIQNLMRQPQIKSTWKTCIWPKEKRQALNWRPRSSGDLKRMLECRHLGNDISNLVRLAFILGTAPFTSPFTPPPGEIDMYFQLPYRGQCPITSPGHNVSNAGSPKPDDDTSSILTTTKSRSSRSSISQSVFRLPSRKSKRSSRPPTPAGIVGLNSTPANSAVSVTSAPSSGPNGSIDTVMGEDLPSGPHPGTPFPIPDESVWPVDAPKFAPEAQQEPPKQINNAAVDGPMMYAMQMEQNPHQSWCAMESFGAYSPQVGMQPGLYDYTMNASQASTVRPATPVPHKRPASWNRVVSVESLRPAKKATLHESIPPEMVPTMLGI